MSTKKVARFMKLILKSWKIFCSIAIGPLTCMGASVPVLNLDPSQMGPAFSVQNTNGMYGWWFNVLAPLTVTGLGWYDEGQDGLFHSHQVGLWWWSGNTGSNWLLGSVNIPAGTSASLDAIYRKLDLQAALTLEPGLYAVGGTYQPQSEDMVRNQIVYNATDLTRDPSVHLMGPAYAIGGGFRFPDGAVLSYGVNVGPMFFVPEVPEPSVGGLLVIGATCCALCWRAKRAAKKGASF